MAIKPTRMTAMLSILELTQVLGVSTKTIHRLIAANRLSCHRVGKQIRFTDDQVAAFLATNGQQGHR